MKYLLAITTLVLLSAVGLATTIFVPDDYPSIQGAIDAASNNDTVIVRPGTYVECINFLGKAIFLQSEEGPEVTLIDGNQQGSVVLFINNETSTSVLDGFTVKNGIGTLPPGENRYYGGGIRCYESSPRIINNIVTANSVMGGSSAGVGGGILCWDLSPNISNNTIFNNEAFFGGGVFCAYGSSVVSNNNIISNYSTYGGGIGCGEGSPIIENNFITENHANYGGGGIDCNSTVQASIQNNTITRNYSNWGVGIAMEFDELSIITNNIISANSASGVGASGGGLAVIHNSVTYVINNTIVGNTVSYNSNYNGGGGVLCRFNSVINIVNTILYNNDAPKGPEIWVHDDYQYDPSTVSISFSDLKGGQSSVKVDPRCTLNWGSGMIDGDPIFVAPASHDYHLTWPSPCRGTGDNSAVTESFDFENDPRIVLGTVDIGADEFYYHLYHTGNVVPGSNVQLKVIGYPLSPVSLAWGQTIIDPPLSTQHGDLYIWPFVWSGFIGNVPTNGVLSMPVTIPSTWNPGDHAPMQALVGPWGGTYSRLSNLMDLTVE